MKKEQHKRLCYLRTHRRVWGLTQEELVRLLGIKSTSHISRIENGKRAPSVESALACQVIFWIPPHSMFPWFYTLVEEKTMRHIYQMHLALKHTTSLSDLRKRELCDAALTRAVKKPRLIEEV